MPIFPKITIITPTYNQAEFIERTIASVLDQNYPNLEYLVYDAASTDGTCEILKKYSRSLTWVSESDQGQSDAINKGMRICSGEIIGFLNSDDELEPGSLMKVGRYFLEHPETPWLTGNCKFIGVNGDEVLKIVTFYKWLLLQTRSALLLRIVNFISQPATFWRKEVLGEIGYLDIELKYVMDYDYWLRLTERYPITFIDENLAKFRTYPSSKTRQSAVLQHDEEPRLIRRYSKSGVMLYFHSIHRLFNILIYTRFLKTK
jgi:glycosyltransferase involved in cell wall biosynthesis